MNGSPQNVEIVRRFCEKVSDSNTFNLDLLRVIDLTVDTLTAICESLDADSKLVYQFVEKVDACELTQAIDPDNVIVGKIESGSSIIAKVVGVLEAGRRAVEADADLHGEHKESLVAAIDQALSSADDLSNGMADLARAITKHDQLLAETVGPFSTVEDLIASLDA